MTVRFYISLLPKLLFLSALRRRRPKLVLTGTSIPLYLFIQTYIYDHHEPQTFSYVICLKNLLTSTTLVSNKLSAETIQVLRPKLPNLALSWHGMDLITSQQMARLPLSLDLRRIYEARRSTCFVCKGTPRFLIAVVVLLATAVRPKDKVMDGRTEGR